MSWATVARTVAVPVAEAVVAGVTGGRIEVRGHQAQHPDPDAVKEVNRCADRAPVGVGKAHGEENTRRVRCHRQRVGDGEDRRRVDDDDVILALEPVEQIGEATR